MIDLFFCQSRIRPSVQPMYQSGTVPAETFAGLNGPKFQIGLIWNRPPIAAQTPTTMVKKAPRLSVAGLRKIIQGGMPAAAPSSAAPAAGTPMPPAGSAGSAGSGGVGGAAA